MVIVDNAPYAFAAQLNNGYPIIPYYDDKSDRELEKLEAYLMEIKDVEDVRVTNKEKFKLADISQHNIEQYVKYYQENNDSTAIEESGEFLKLQQSLQQFLKGSQ